MIPSSTAISPYLSPDINFRIFNEIEKNNDFYFLVALSRVSRAFYSHFSSDGCFERFFKERHFSLYADDFKQKISVWREDPVIRKTFNFDGPCLENSAENGFKFDLFSRENPTDYWKLLSFCSEKISQEKDSKSLEVHLSDPLKDLLFKRAIPFLCDFLEEKKQDAEKQIQEICGLSHEAPHLESPMGKARRLFVETGEWYRERKEKIKQEEREALLEIQKRHGNVRKIRDFLNSTSDIFALYEEEDFIELASREQIILDPDLFDYYRVICTGAEEIRNVVSEFWKCDKAYHELEDHCKQLEAQREACNRDLALLRDQDFSKGRNSLIALRHIDNLERELMNGIALDAKIRFISPFMEVIDTLRPSGLLFTIPNPQISDRIEGLLVSCPFFIRNTIFRELLLHSSTPNECKNLCSLLLSKWFRGCSLGLFKLSQVVSSYYNSKLMEMHSAVK